MTDENKLIKKAQKGDADAFEKIISEYQNVVYSVAYRYADNAEDAADMSQEIFLKMFRNINTFQFKSKLSTWIYRVATNTCIDLVKKTKNVRNTYSIDDGYENSDGETKFNEIADDSSQPDIAVENGEIRDVINMAISRLSDDYRLVIILRDIQGLSYDEISEIVGCSVGTVKSRISRGRKNLREILFEDRELFEKYYV
ncbi:MAG: sigma-70 family RNA polymerase sigma factor [Clostridiales bacterium]|nr:sigma-70 family RNA polymerase sigma factor [Clostridiales bacterium]